MTIRERSLTKMYLLQIRDWDAFQRVMRNLL